MPEQGARLSDVRSCRTRPDCERPSDVPVQYERGWDRGPDMARLPRGKRAGVNLFRRRAEEEARRH